MRTQFKLGDLSVDVALKDIKNIHLSVNPPHGAVRISAPSRMSLDTIRVFAISKLSWIRQQQKKLREQEREPPREYLDRESHYVWGKRYLLEIVDDGAEKGLTLKHQVMVLRVRQGADDELREALVARWYREQIKVVVPGLVAKWEPIMGVKVERFFVRKMKTKWGSCNPRNRTIRLNTDLAKKRPEYLEYVVVHEMAHLRVRRHNDEFRSLMDLCLPNWQVLRQGLNEAPLGHSEWEN
jgi:hypothetical protein